MDKNTKVKLDATMKTVTETAKSKKGKIAGIIILVIILLNTFWNMMENKMTSDLQAMKADLAALNTRLAEMEKSTSDFEAVNARLTKLERATVDSEAVKADVEAINTASDNFEVKLNAVVKAEEAKLEIFAKDLENHKSYLEGLKGLLAGETGK